MANWSSKATNALLLIWGEQSVQAQLCGLVRNKIVYEGVADCLQGQGFDFTWKQCRTKIKNLTQAYRKAKSNNSACPFFDELDAIIGAQATLKATVALDGAVPPEDDDDLFIPLRTSPVIVSPQRETEETAPPQPLRAGNPSTSTTAELLVTKQPQRLGKRKRQIDYLEMLAELEEAAERREDERERRRLEFLNKMEGERMEREQRHEERLMSMFFTMFNQSSSSSTAHNNIP